MRKLSELKPSELHNIQSVAIFIGCFAPFHSGHIDVILSADHYIQSVGMGVQFIIIVPHKDNKIKRKVTFASYGYTNRVDYICEFNLATHHEVIVDDLSCTLSYGPFDNARKEVISHLQSQFNNKNVNIVMIVGEDKLERALPFVTNHTIICVRRPSVDLYSEYFCASDNLIFIDRSNMANDISSTEIRQKGLAKNIYLTSYAKEVLADISVKAKGKRALFIPTAGDPYDDKDFVKADRDKLVELGFSVADFDLKDKAADDVSAALASVDLVLVAGGNTFYLMYYINRSGFRDELLKFLEVGGTYVGSSAGSIVCCPTTIGAVEFDKAKQADELSDYNGMNLVSEIVIPHCQKEKYMGRINRMKNYLKPQYSVFTIKDNQYIDHNGGAHIVTIENE